MQLWHVGWRLVGKIYGSAVYFRSTNIVGGVKRQIRGLSITPYSLQYVTPLAHTYKIIFKSVTMFACCLSYQYTAHSIFGTVTVPCRHVYVALSLSSANCRPYSEYHACVERCTKFKWSAGWRHEAYGLINYGSVIRNGKAALDSISIVLLSVPHTHLHLYRL